MKKRTRGGRMVGADDFTEQWWHPLMYHFRMHFEFTLTHMHNLDDLAVVLIGLMLMFECVSLQSCKIIQ